MEHHKKEVQAVAWNHYAPEVLLSVSRDRTVVMKDGRDPSHSGLKWSTKAKVENLAWDPHGEHSFVTSLKDGTVKGFDTRASDLSPSFTLHAHDREVSSISYNIDSPDLLATGSGDESVKLWDLSNNQPSWIATHNPNAGIVFSVSFSADCPFLLAVGGSEGKLKVSRHFDDTRNRFLHMEIVQNPYSQFSGFLNLLHNQQQTQNPELIPYEMVSPSIQLGESEAYVFSSQSSEAPTEVDDRRLRRKWTPTEDVVLISAWLNTSKDPIVGNEQKAEAFWKRIAAYFASSPKLVGLQKREPSHCKQRWGKINDIVCKFVGCFEAASKQKSSGQNDNDVMKLAHQIYFNDHKHKFTLEHAWRELRHDQKWCELSGSGMSKRRKTDEGSTQSSTSEPVSHEEAQARPPGVKASKAKSKRTVNKAAEVVKEGNALLEFQSMWEIKQKDLTMKERFSKHKLLDSLLAKTEPLSELEMALKNKLINDMLNS